MPGRTDGQIVEAVARLGVMRRAVSRCCRSLFFSSSGSSASSVALTSPTTPRSMRRAPSELLRPDVDLRDARRALRIELPIGKVRAEHQQHIAIEHRVIAGREADQPGHADVVGIVPFDMLLAAHRMHHRRLERLAERQQLGMRAGASGAAQDRHATGAVEQRGERSRSAGGGTTTGLGGSRPRDVGGGASAAGCSATSPGITTTDTPPLPTASRIAISSTARHLVGAGDELAVMAAFLEQVLRMGFLEIASADLGRRNLRGDRQHRHARAVAVEQAVDEVQIARAAASRADGEPPVRCASAPAAKAATSSWRT